MNARQALMIVRHQPLSWRSAAYWLATAAVTGELPPDSASGQSA